MGMPGTSQTVRLALQLRGEAQMKRPLDAAALTVQMAARSMRQNVQKAPVAMFAVQIPAEVFLDDSHSAALTDKAQWRAIAASEDQSQTLKQCKNGEQSALRAVMERSQCTWIADRQIQGRGVSLYFASTLRGVAMLLEVSLANNGACRMVVKSKDKYLSYVTCQAAVKLVNM